MHTLAPLCKPHFAQSSSWFQGPPICSKYSQCSQQIWVFTTNKLLNRKSELFCSLPPTLIRSSNLQTDLFLGSDPSLYYNLLLYLKHSFCRALQRTIPRQETDLNRTSKQISNPKDLDFPLLINWLVIMYTNREIQLLHLRRKASS